MSVPVLTNRAARAIFLDRHGLAERPVGPGKGADLADVLDRLGFVQLDSVNTFARAHDLILHARRPRYRPQALELALSRDRAVFEHWTHDAAAIPMVAYPHWKLRFARDRALLQRQWSAWRRGDFASQIEQVHRHIADHGASGSRDVGRDEAKGSGGWWDWHPSKTALEFLWRSGELAVSRREGFRKVYDLTERVIPDAVRLPTPDPEETLDWLCAGALDRLGFATSGEISAFWATATPAEAKAWCSRAASRGAIVEVDVQGVDGKRRRSFARPDLLDTAPPPVYGGLRILSPFDPALRDRARAERLFGFTYRIEIFVPAPRRRYGYYVFPVLEGDRLIGRIDMKRDGAVLAVRAFWPDSRVRMGKSRKAALLACLERAATFGGCTSLTFENGWLRLASSSE